MEIGEKIRQARLQKGLSQENVADSLHISTTAYGDIERNKSEISVTRLLKICQILEVPIEEILKNSIHQSDFSDEIIQLKAELLLAKTESQKWKDRFMQSVFENRYPRSRDRPKIGFK
ncbi:MAG: helix-turn-helix transcriptional regulator [Bacteroidota bacterium]